MDEEFTFVKFRRNIGKLSRAQSSSLIQARTGHIPLKYLLAQNRKI